MEHREEELIREHCNHDEELRTLRKNICTSNGSSRISAIRST